MGIELHRGTVVAERFRLVRELDQGGGLGSVWLAEHLAFGFSCAIKFVAPELARDAEVCARFLREADRAARLGSPHVVRIMDYGLWGDVPFVAMEFLQGEDLGRRLQRLGRLPSAETLAIVRQVALALESAHAAGMAHFDLKPANVFLAADEEGESVKVLDFGLANAIRGMAFAVRTRTRVAVTTPSYLSPEQLRASTDVDHRCDLWALGVLAFVCLTGNVPFGDEAHDVIARIFSSHLVLPTDFVPELPRAVDAWWARVSAPNIEDRFSSAFSMAESLSSTLSIQSMRNRQPASRRRVALQDSDSEVTRLFQRVPAPSRAAPRQRASKTVGSNDERAGARGGFKGDSWLDGLDGDEVLLKSLPPPGRSGTGGGLVLLCGAAGVAWGVAAGLAALTHILPGDKLQDRSVAGRCASQALAWVSTVSSATAATSTSPTPNEDGRPTGAGDAAFPEAPSPMPMPSQSGSVQPAPSRRPLVELPRRASGTRSGRN